MITAEVAKLLYELISTIDEENHHLKKENHHLKNENQQLKIKNEELEEKLKRQIEESVQGPNATGR